MTTKDNFAEEEWKHLHPATTHATTYIISAAMSPAGAMQGAVNVLSNSGV